MSAGINLLFAENLTVGYRPGFPIVSEVMLKIEAGATYALLGGNGVGKSTIFKTLTGLIPPLDGRIVKRESLAISYVPQSKKMRIDYPISVEDVLLMGRNLGLSFFPKRKFMPSEIDLLEQTQVAPILKKHIAECSGGQLQKVLILRSLFTSAHLLFLDEPMDSLDHSSRELFQKILAEDRIQNKRAIFVITHNKENDWNSPFDEILEIDEGKLYHVSQGELPPNCHHHE
ncbi:ABC transporter, ATP-binding protein [Leptospira ryugenii]|uniref:ABC transporter, ATP-binding protein n=1 Tax=Leptospira ryugenii TaxID=1917863 RepID=A0A2P2DVL0_9LEPT|nr:ATP-binding cassette domain-containing protein [Leptospira ryugenii]GBF48681.1 ABC transporter, ATP-binding protein [Leptospira ryugenii]